MAPRRPTGRVTLQGVYTLSRTFGNVDGETSAGGPNTALPDNYPENREGRWNYPVGDLSIDQRHKARILATYSLPVTSAGDLTIGTGAVLQLGNTVRRAWQHHIRPYVPANLGYRGAPASIPYFFTARDAFRADVSSSTDLAATLNYACSATRRRSSRRTS